MVSNEELQQIMPNLPKPKRDLYLPLLQAAMTEFEITSFLREAAFLAQIAHESVELRYMEEIADGSAYEGRQDLGNTQPGDGRRFKGRGPIQLTGRANYRKYGPMLGLDLIADPKQAATPEVGFRIAGLYWKLHGLNELADNEEFRKITKGINGGLIGLQSRVHYYERAKLVLSKDDAQPADASPPRVVVNGKKVTNAQPFLRGGRLLVALRPVATAAGLGILEAGQGRAIVQDAKSERHQVPLLIQGGTGFVALADLPGTVTWDDATRTGSLQTA